MSENTFKVIRNPSFKADLSLDEIEEKILNLKQECTVSCIQIGKLLLSAKKCLKKHGEWMDWVNKNLDMSISKVEQLMRIALIFSEESKLVQNLGYSKLVIIATLDNNEIKNFLEQKHLIGNQEKNIIDMTRREIQDAVRSIKGQRNKSESDKNDSFSSSKTAKNFTKHIETIKKEISTLKENINEITTQPDVFQKELDSLYELCSSIITLINPTENI